MREYELGEYLWFYNSNHKGDLTKGKLVHKFKLNDNAMEQLVLEIDTPVDPYYVVRCYFTVSEDNTEINLYKRNKK